MVNGEGYQNGFTPGNNGLRFFMAKVISMARTGERINPDVGINTGVLNGFHPESRSQSTPIHG